MKTAVCVTLLTIGIVCGGYVLSSHADCFIDCRDYSCIGIEVLGTCHPYAFEQVGGFISYDHGIAHGKLFCPVKVANQSKPGLVENATISTCGCLGVLTGAVCQGDPMRDWAMDETCDCILAY